jgi:hypothetical protein
MKKHLPTWKELVIPAILAGIFTYESQNGTFHPGIIFLIWAIYFIIQCIVYIAMRVFVKIATEDGADRAAIQGIATLTTINFAVTCIVYLVVLQWNLQSPMVVMQWIAYPSMSLFMAISEIIAIIMVGLLTLIGFNQFANDL